VIQTPPPTQNPGCATAVIYNRNVTNKLIGTTPSSIAHSSYQDMPMSIGTSTYFTWGDWAIECDAIDKAKKKVFVCPPHISEMGDRQAGFSFPFLFVCREGYSGRQLRTVRGPNPGRGCLVSAINLSEIYLVRIWHRLWRYVTKGNNLVLPHLGYFIISDYNVKT